jgi:type II secretory pathway component PulC
MTQEKISAEEKLLQMIQNGGESPLPKKRSFFGGLRQKLRLAFRRGESHPSPKRAKASMPARLNRTLSLSSVLVMSFSVANIFFFKPDIGKLHGRVAETLPVQEHPNLNPLPMEEILASIADRSLFQPGAVEPEPKESSSAAASPSGVLENLKLVGIAWGAISEAMIREVKEGRTFFLKEGEQIMGVVVKEILKDRVIVEHEGQTKELM